MIKTAGGVVADFGGDVSRQSDNIKGCCQLYRHLGYHGGSGVIQMFS